MRVFPQMLIPMGVTVIAGSLAAFVFARSVTAQVERLPSSTPSSECEHAISSDLVQAPDFGQHRHQDHLATDGEVMVIGEYFTADGESAWYTCRTVPTIAGGYRVSWWNEARPKVQ